MNCWSTAPTARRMVGDIYLGQGRSRTARHPGRVRRHRHREERVPPRVRSRLSRRRGDDDDDEDDEDDDDERAASAAAARPTRESAADSGCPEARPGPHRPGLQGADLDQGPARHRAGLAGRPLPRLHAVRLARRREPQDRRARRAQAAARAGRRRCCPTNSGGVIVRTVGEDVTQETFERELHDAHRAVEAASSGRRTSCARRRSCIARRASRAASSATSSATRSSSVTVDSKQVYNEIVEYLKGIAPELIERVKLYEDTMPLFDKAEIEHGDPRPVQAALRPAVGRLPDHRADRSARLGRRELRPLHRQEGSGEDDPQDEHRGGARDRAPAPAARRRRHHRLRLHRHGDEGEPRQGAAGAAHAPRPRPRAHEGVRGERARPDRDDAPARAAEPSPEHDRGVPDLPRHRARVHAPRRSCAASSARCGGSASRARRIRCSCKLHPDVAMYVLENEQDLMQKLEKAVGFSLELRDDPLLKPDEFKLVVKGAGAGRDAAIRGGLMLGCGAGVATLMSRSELGAATLAGIQMPIQSYRDLIVWQRAMDLLTECYRVARLLPPSEIVRAGSASGARGGGRGGAHRGRARARTRRVPGVAHGGHRVAARGRDVVARGHARLSALGRPDPDGRCSSATRWGECSRRFGRSLGAPHLQPGASSHAADLPLRA